MMAPASKIITQKTAEGFALAFATLTFSALALVAAPSLEEQQPLLKVVAALIGGVSLSALFVVSRQRLNRIWAKDVLGTWIYETIPHDASKRHLKAYGVATFDVDTTGSITYQVDLYRSVDDAVRATAGGQVTSHGTAEGVAVEYDQEKRGLFIYYVVRYYASEERDRDGRLFLNVTGHTGHRVLRGTWASDLDAQELSAGQMTAVRPYAAAAAFSPPAP